MSELVLIGRNAPVTTDEANTVTNVEEPITEDEGITTDIDINNSSLEGDLEEAETDMNLEGEGITGEEGVTPKSFEEGVDDGMIIDPNLEEGEQMDLGLGEEYMDLGFFEGEFMDPTMETGMGQVKDPLLSSWPFVIGISAAVLAVSIVLGALLAKLKIKKGIDLYED